MNPEMPRKPQDELEARLTALLLGELPHEQAAALHLKLTQDAELAALYERLKQTINLVRETVASPAPKTAEPLLPLRFEEKRRQKLLAHFKTIAPKEFAKPRRRWAPRLIELGIAVSLVALLGALLLPALPKAKLKAMRLATLSRSIEETAELATPAPADKPVAMDYLGLGEKSRTELFASEGETRRGITVAAAPASAIPAQDRAKGAAIALPEVATAGDATLTANYSLQAESKPEASSRGFYSESLGRPAGTHGGSGGAYGAFTGAARGGAALAEGRKADGDVDDFFSRSDFGIASQAGRPADDFVDSRSPGERPAVPALGASPSFLGLAPAAAGKPSAPAAAPQVVAAAPASVPVNEPAGQSESRRVITENASIAAGTELAKGVEVARVPMQTRGAEMAAGDLVVAGRGRVGGVGGLPPGVIVNRGELAQEGVLSLDDKSKDVLDSPVAAGRLQAGSDVKAAAAGQPAGPSVGYAMSEPPASEALYFGHGFTPSQPAAAGEVAARSAEKFDWDDTARGAQAQKYQWFLNGDKQAGLANADGRQAPVLGDVAAIQLYRREGEEVDRTARAKVEEKVEGVELADKLDSTAGGVNKGLYSANVVGYVNLDVRATNLVQLAKASTLQERFAEQEQKVREAQKKVEELRKQGSTVNAVASASGPVPVPAEDAAPAKPAAPPPVPQPEVQTSDNAFSTFSLNVSDVSFKLAGASLEKGVMPEAASVRSEEFINAFDYRDPEAPPGAPVAFAWERARYPFAQNRDLLRFSVKTAAQGRAPGRALNLVLLLDNSGSMERADRVRIIREALRVLAGQLQPRDKFSVVTFSRTARLWVDGVRGNVAAQVVGEISGMTPQGGTNLEGAMDLAYQTALRHYLAGGVNRVVLLTDGAANLGNVEPEALKQKVEAYRKQGVALDCFGIGWEGYNDDLLEVLSRNGDGRYGFVNSPEEAATEFAGQLAGALRVAASDVKVQVEFNPARVAAYRQIGYAKHQLTKEQFRDNTVDAAEIGAAESGNALYVVETNPRGEGPLAIVRVRYKVPGTADYREQEWAVPYTGNSVGLEQASPALRLAATASAFSEWLVSSPYAAEVTPDRLLGYLGGVPEVYGADGRPKRLEWMIRQAKSIAGK